MIEEETEEVVDDDDDDDDDDDHDDAQKFLTRVDAWIRSQTMTREDDLVPFTMHFFPQPPPQPQPEGATLPTDQDLDRPVVDQDGHRDHDDHAIHGPQSQSQLQSQSESEPRRRTGTRHISSWRWIWARHLSLCLWIVLMLGYLRVMVLLLVDSSSLNGGFSAV